MAGGMRKAPAVAPIKGIHMPIPGRPHLPVGVQAPTPPPRVKPGAASARQYGKAPAAGFGTGIGGADSIPGDF